MQDEQEPCLVRLDALTEPHRDYLEDRQVDVKVAARYGVTSAIYTSRSGNRMNMIAIPYTRDGVIAYDKLIEPQTKKMFCYPGGDQTTPWNVDCLKGERTGSDVLTITEGEIDALTVLSLNDSEHVISLPSGAGETESACENKSKIFRMRTKEVNKDGHEMVVYHDEPTVEYDRFEAINLLMDADLPGKTMSESLQRLFGLNYCRIPTYPQGCKDANDVACLEPSAVEPDEHGESDIPLCGYEALRHVIKTARRADGSGTLSLLDAALKKSRAAITISETIFPNGELMLQPGGIMTLGAMANAGKTTLLFWMLAECSKNNPGSVFAMFQGEGEAEDAVLNLRRYYRKNMAGGSTSSESAQKDRDAWISRTFRLMQPPRREGPTFDWLERAIRQAAIDDGATVAVVDVWNNLLLEMKPGESMTLHIKNCLIRLKLLADELGVAIIIAHHITADAARNMADSGPGMYSLSDSQHWANFSEHVVMLSQPPNGGDDRRIFMAKVRAHKRAGLRESTVFVSFHFDNFDFTYYDNKTADGSDRYLPGKN